jgi:hypothetical protein
MRQHSFTLEYDTFRSHDLQFITQWILGHCVLDIPRKIQRPYGTRKVTDQV